MLKSVSPLEKARNSFSAEDNVDDDDDVASDELAMSGGSDDAFIIRGNSSIMAIAGDETSSTISSTAPIADAPLPKEFRYIPAVFRYDQPPGKHPIEATGLAVSTYGTGPILMASMFLGPALLQLASQAAGCDADNNGEEEECHNKVYGFRPSSLLSNLAIASGLIGAVTMPVFGAVVDHTRYRRQVGLVSVVGLTVVKALEVMVGRHTWFFVTLLQFVSSIFYNIYVTASYAYRSELSHHPDELSHYNTFYNVIQYISMLAFLLQVLVLAFLLGTDNIGTARISQTIASTTAGLFFISSWSRLFRDRPPSRMMVSSHNNRAISLLASGFSKVWHTTQKIYGQYKAFQWAIVSIAFNEAAMSSLVTVATTYLTEVLRMNASEIGLVFLLVLITGIPGSMLGNWVSLQLHSPVRSILICDVVFIVVTTWASWTLTEPAEKHRAYFFSILWGLAMGWLSPVDTTLFMALMPKDARAEMMGIFALVVQILSWLPPLLFTALNEAGMSMAYGLASLNLFFLIAMFFLILVGDYHKGCRDAEQQLVDGRNYERAADEVEAVDLRKSHKGGESSSSTPDGGGS